MSCFSARLEIRIAPNTSVRQALQLNRQYWEGELCSGEVAGKARTSRIDAECVRDWLGAVWEALFSC
jgi:hypothetical protein